MRGASPQQSTLGIVIRRQAYGESDRIVEVLTPEHGRLALFAPGARASRRRFQGVLELFGSAQLELVVRRGMWRLEAASLVSARLGIRRSLEQIERATLLVDAVRALAPEQHEARAFYDALDGALEALDAGDLPRASEAYPRLLTAAGILPPLERCGHCARGLAGEGLWLDATLGTVHCAQCAAGELELSPQAAAVWRGASCGDLATADAVERAAVGWLAGQLGQPLRSVRSLAQRAPGAWGIGGMG